MICAVKYLLTVYLLILTAACAAEKPDSHIYRAGRLEDAAVDESSGLAASRRHPDILWTINDSGGLPVLYALTASGASVGRIRIDGAANRDWEDLAAFRHGNDAYLVVGDVGDNAARRDFCTIYVVREPEIAGNKIRDPAATPAWRIRFRYADGPRDCEAIAVDSAARRILLLSKRTVPPVLYEVPLFRRSGGSLSVARKLAEVALADRAESAGTRLSGLLRSHPYRNHPTGMDILPNGTLAAILTYRFMYLYHRPEGLDWETAFAGVPRVLPLPRLEQAEAVCFSADGRDLFVTSERRGAPLLKIPLASF